MSVRLGHRVGRRASYGLGVAILATVLLACHGAPTASPAPVVVAVSLPSAPASSPPSIPGLSDNEVASLASLEQIDDYPLYVMHLYGAQPASYVPVENGRPAWACSLFAAMGDPDHSLYGRNFDWSYSPALLLFSHPEEGYGSVSMVDLGYFFAEDEWQDLAGAPLEDRAALLQAGGWPFDGMNEMGLAVGMAAVPDAEVPYDPALPTVGSLGMIRRILDRAATVDEAVALAYAYNVDMTGGPTVHYLIADAAGHAALIEFTAGEVVVIPNESSWHLATNHYRASLPASDGGGCWRYAELDEVLTAASGKLAVVDAFTLLADVAQPSTQWSAVYDMSARDVHVVVGQGYDRVHTFDLEDEKDR